MEGVGFNCSTRCEGDGAAPEEAEAAVACAAVVVAAGMLSGSWPRHDRGCLLGWSTGSASQRTRLCTPCPASLPYGQHVPARELGGWVGGWGGAGWSRLTVVSPQDSATPRKGWRASLGIHGPERTAALIHYFIGDSASTLRATLRVRPHHTRAPLGRGTNRVLGPRSEPVAVRHLGAEMC